MGTSYYFGETYEAFASAHWSRIFIFLVQNMLSATELFNKVLSCLHAGTVEPDKLAWNILAWQFNSSQVSGTTKCNPDEWAKPESPGLYITYTYAKLQKALKCAGFGDINKVEQAHADILGLANYYHYYFNSAQEKLQPCLIANFAMTLAKELSGVYATNKIIGGSDGLIFALNEAVEILGCAMKALGMYLLEKV